MAAVTYCTAAVDGLQLCSREAGAAAAPPRLRLHGCPSASQMCRDLIPRLAARVHVSAPALPGCGPSGMPPRRAFRDTVDPLASVLARVTTGVGLERGAVEVCDDGALAGFRRARRPPARLTARVSPHGHADAEGLRDGWHPLRASWAGPSPPDREALRALLSPETTRWQSTHGVPAPTAGSPDGSALATCSLARPGADDVQVDRFGDSQRTGALDPAVQADCRTDQPPCLAVWGQHDPCFRPPGAEAFTRDRPGAVGRCVDTGQVALATPVAEGAAAIRDFLAA
jgi:pimeloyl-ACP methyl ester carboxylesterase